MEYKNEKIEENVEIKKFWDFKNVYLWLGIISIAVVGIILFLFASSILKSNNQKEAAANLVQKNEGSQSVDELKKQESGNEKIALVMKALSNPFFAKMEEGAKEYAQENKIILDVFGVERETDIDHQIAIMENLISRKYTAIVIAPADSKKLIPVCKKAIDQGIMVINIDNPFDKEILKENNIKIPFVGSDNYKGANMIAEYVLNKLGNKGDVFVIEGIRGVENADLRRDGFVKTITANTDIKIIASESANWHTDEAFSLVTNLLKKHGEVDAIFCANDNMALGVLQALDIYRPKKQILIVSYDNIEDVRRAMASQRMHATIEQHPELMGAYGVELAAKAINGENIPEYKSTPLDLVSYETFNKKIGVSMSDLENQFFLDISKAIKKKSDLLGLNLTILDAKNDSALQWIDLKKFVDDDFDIIIVNPTNSDTINPAIKLANTANIPVITIDRSATEADILSHVASNNVSGGFLAGEYLSSALFDGAKILELEGIPGTSASQDRGIGFDQAIEKDGRFQLIKEVADFDREKASIIMNKNLQNNVHFDAVFAQNDNMILGVLDALKTANIKKRPVLVGFDAISEVVEAVKSGEINATVAQKTMEMGERAVDTVSMFFRGEKIEKTQLLDLSLIVK